MQINKEINPFITTLVIPYKEFNNGYSEATDEPLAPYEVEAERHTRIYNDRAKRLFMYKLSIYARDMFMAMQYFMHSSNHYVVISYDKMHELLGDDMYGKRRYEDTVRELIKHSVIDYKDKPANQYWYNPAYFSPGSRLRLFPDAQKVRIN
jgi:hypothetical protein